MDPEVVPEGIKLINKKVLLGMLLLLLLLLLLLVVVVVVVVFRAGWLSPTGAGE